LHARLLSASKGCAAILNCHTVRGGPENHRSLTWIDDRWGDTDLLGAAEPVEFVCAYQQAHHGAEDR
jgi:hypothetical protein